MPHAESYEQAMDDWQRASLQAQEQQSGVSLAEDWESVGFIYGPPKDTVETKIDTNTIIKYIGLGDYDD